MNKNDKDTRRDYFHKGLTAFCVIAAAIVFFFLILRLGDITGFFGKTINVLQPVIMGLVIAYLINPVVNFLNATKPCAILVLLPNKITTFFNSWLIFSVYCCMCIR